MKRIFIIALMAIVVSTALNYATAQQGGVATYHITNPFITTSGSFTGTLTSNGYTSPYYSLSRSLSGSVTTDTIGQRILGYQFGVSIQWSYTKASGSPSGVIYTEVSNDTGATYATGNWTSLYTDSVRSAAGAQTYVHAIAPWV